MNIDVENIVIPVRRSIALTVDSGRLFTVTKPPCQETAFVLLVGYYFRLDCGDAIWRVPKNHQQLTRDWRKLDYIRHRRTRAICGQRRHWEWYNWSLMLVFEYISELITYSFQDQFVWLREEATTTRRKMLRSS